jgi:hypothetical protein
MAKYAALPFTRKQSERKISGRTFSDQQAPNVTGITSGGCSDCCGHIANFSGPFEGLTTDTASITIFFNSLSNLGPGANYQVWMAPSGRFNNNCTNSYMRPLVSGSGLITGGVSSFTFNGGVNNAGVNWQYDTLGGVWANSALNIPMSEYGKAAFYKICLTNGVGSGCSPWTAVVTKDAYNCNCTCPGGYEEACCCFDCSGDGITCCDDGGTPATCCRGECSPGDPGYACGFTCPGGEVCDTCYNCQQPMNTGACS